MTVSSSDLVPAGQPDTRIIPHIFTAVVGRHAQPAPSDLALTVPERADAIAALAIDPTELNEAERIAKLAQSFTATADAIRVVDAKTRTEAVKHAREVQGLKKTITDLIAPWKKACDALKQSVLTIEKNALGDIERAKNTFNARVMTYDQALEAEKRRHEEAERERLRAQLEEEALMAAAFSDEPDASTGAGGATLANLEQAVEQALVEQLPEVSSAQPADEGFYYVDTYDASITDIEALAKGIAAGTVPLAILDESVQIRMCAWLKKQAEQMGGEVAYPGVVIIKGKAPRVRRS